MVKTEKNWFAAWFAPPTYHISQRDRGFKEVDTFKEKISRFFGFSSRAGIFSLANINGWSRICIINDCTNSSCTGPAIIERFGFFGSYRLNLFDEQRKPLKPLF